MLPSLVAADLRASLTSFLGTTFALADDDVRAELQGFIADDDHGVFRGPYVRLRLPFRPAPDGWRASTGFAPRGFTPHHHQARAWGRLSSLHSSPEPTIVTTGTGSGKTESFLVPLLDHCARHRDVRGIKAIVLYPMNALANDQARRVAALIHDHPAELAGVRVGLYTGDSPDGSEMSAAGVIGNRHTLRAHPPDVLLTNYKMLDMLLLRSEDSPLFAGAAQALRYLVLDEFHTYDGAQGTDVAMLLRRLGMALNSKGIDGPLTGITPVATSATLGTGSSVALREFAETVFGRPFGEDSLVGEDRTTPDEWATGPSGAIPLLDQVLGALKSGVSHASTLDNAAHVFLGHGAADRVRLGASLRAHPLTPRLVALASTSTALADVAAAVEPGWSTRVDDASTAVSAYLALLTAAWEPDGRPLLNVDVQLWMRELTRVVRRLDVAPRFAWDEGAVSDDARMMAALFCRHCGRSGWGAAAKAAGGYSIDPAAVRAGALSERRLQRAWIFAPGEGATDDPRVQWAEPETAELHRTPSGRHSSEVPVMVTPDEDGAKKQRCPACGVDDGIRFLGSSVATLASTALGQVFASPDVDDAQKRTLVFTDSVQDASHRAAFIESRAYALNRRSLLLRAIAPAGDTLANLGANVVADARTHAERYAVLPPDLKNHETFRRYWSLDEVTAETRTLVGKLMNFEAARELGLSARVGRTLELTGAATAHVDAADLAALAATALTDVGQLALDGGPRVGIAWARGVLERIRLQGGIEHPWLDKYVVSGGNRYSIWGGRPRREGMPAFPAGRPAPRFPTTARASDAFDTISGAAGWYARWSARALGVPAVDAPRYVRALLDACVAAGVLRAVTGEDKARVWVLPPARVRVHRTDDDRPSTLRCEVCRTVLPAHPEVVDQLTGAPCVRVACSGRYATTTLDADYYRDLYRAGQVRRIVAHEHTSLLPPDVRVGLENRFKQTTQSASDPNVLTCTPTLELGIDIGDLSLVALTSLPRSTASYLQRVGRAGRLTGSSLVLSLLPARPLELQRLANPLTMIAGDVVPPACYLDAVEILRRQYLASLVDRQARIERSRPLRRAVEVFAGELTPTSWLGRLVADGRTNAETYVAEFLAGFGDAVAKETQAELAVWAGARSDGAVPEMERAVERARQSWIDELDELDHRRAALRGEVARIEAAPSLDDAQQRDLKRVRGELGSVRRALADHRGAYWISVLERLGLLPSYNLIDDATQLDVGLWWTDEETGAAERSDDSYLRGSRAALGELAPGATFYVRGTSIEIDGLDLGTSRNPTTERRRFCPSCGWSGPEATAITSCPRCLDPAAADVGQVVRTLPFRKASAYASRELALRDEDSDERRRTSFTLVPTVDADPADVTAAWGLESYQFGAEVLRRADIRWLNLGPSARRGATWRVAGGDEAPSMFEACTSCGVVWSAQRGVQSPADARHRGWCPQRKTPRADGWASVVLTHHLRTQAVRLLVPPVVLVDDTLLTSFRAALLLGLRQVLGGDPDHLDVLIAVDPNPGSLQRWAMVLHDVVPGGTGYLARFAEPEQVRRLLRAALDVLLRCECQDEQVHACHRCLLPHVRSSLAPYARRDRAVELLREILDGWVPRKIESLRSIVVGAHDTPIEDRFRRLLVRWASGRGAQVDSHITSVGDRVDITFPGVDDHRRWKLTPQVKHGFVQPDFDLTTDDPEVPTIAVFCDGLAFHASAEHNRVADDAAKRHRLRERGVLVWAVTHTDLDAFKAVLDGKPRHDPDWASPAVFTKVDGYGTQVCQAGDVPASAVMADPVSVLTAYLLRPELDRWTAAARCVAYALAAAQPGEPVLSTPEALPVLARAALGGEVPSVPAGPAQLMTLRTPSGAVLALEPRGLGAVRAVLGIDDRDGVVGVGDHRHVWREWLALSNILQLLEPGSFASHSLSELPTEVRATEIITINMAWQELVDAFDGPMAQLLRRLAETGIDVPEGGLEVADGEYVIDLAWPAARVAVVQESDAERDAWLAAHRWTVLPPDDEQVLAVLIRQEVAS